MKALMAALMLWLQPVMGIDNVSRPNVQFLPQHQLAIAYYEKEVSADVAERVEAFYSDTTQTIYLPDTWELDNLRHQSNLLHELVHHLQNVNGLRFDCTRQREHQAYEAQFEWLSQHGVEDPMKYTGMNMLFYVFVAGENCPHTMFEGH